MTDQQYPITPPPELVNKWTSLACEEEGWESWDSIATQAAQWGADQQLEACDKWLVKYGLRLSGIARFRAAMRPKPPSPNEEALRVLENLIETGRLNVPEYQALRHALEALPNG